MYFIACFEKIDISKGFLDTGDLRIFGYFKEKENAFISLKENLYNMHEYYFNYAVVEKIEEGIHPIVDEEYFFKYNNELNSYELIDKPNELEHFCNFSIG